MDEPATAPPPATQVTQTPPAQTPAATPAPAEAAKADDSSISDSVWNSLIAGLGMAIGQPTPPPPEPIKVDETFGMSIAERMKFEDEKKQIAEAAAKTTPATTAAPQETPPAIPAVVTPPSDTTPTGTPAPTPQSGAMPELPPKVEIVQKLPTDKIVEQTVKKVLEQQQAAAAQKPEEKPATPAPDPFEATLSEIEREELELAKLAAKGNARYSGLPDQLLTYLKKRDAYWKAASAKDPERTFDDNDEEFVKFEKANKPPALSPVDRRKLIEERITAQVTERLTAENNKKLAEVERRTHLLEVLPKIQSVAQQFSTGTHQLLAKDPNSLAAPIVKRASEVGWDAVAEEDPLFAPIVRDFHSRATELATEYSSLLAGVKPFDGQNRDHIWLMNFVNGQSQAVAQNPQARIRNGKTFLSPSEYNTMADSDPNGVNAHWTFSERDVLERLAQNTVQNVETVLKTQQEKLTKAGFERKKPAGQQNGAPKQETAPAAQPAAAPAQASIKTTPSAAPGAGVTTPPQTNTWSPSMLKALGLPV